MLGGGLCLQGPSQLKLEAVLTLSVARRVVSLRPALPIGPPVRGASYRSLMSATYSGASVSRQRCPVAAGSRSATSKVSPCRTRMLSLESLPTV